MLSWWDDDSKENEQLIQIVIFLTIELHVSKRKRGQIHSKDPDPEPGFDYPQRRFVLLKVH